MKTFLWTTLFWIVAAIAGLLCLGFGNLGTQVLDNERLASIMPKNLKAESCDAVLETALENIDWCAAAEANDCSITAIETSKTENVSEDTAKIQESLSSILETQESMYKEMKESLLLLSEKMNGVNNIVSDNEQSVEALRNSLQADLEKAISEERYEDAANIRDQLKELD